MVPRSTKISLRLVVACACLASLTPCAAALADAQSDLAAAENQFDKLYDAGSYAEAEPYGRKMVSIAERSFANQPQVVSICLEKLGNVHRELGRYNEAEQLLKRALALREKALGAEHIEVARCQQNLAALYRRLARFAEAEPLYKRALAIREKKLGSNHVAVGGSLTGLALMYTQQRRYAEAEPLYLRAREIFENPKAQAEMDLATCLSNMAMMYDCQGRYAEGEKACKRALKISEKIYPGGHPQIATDLEVLASLYDSQGRHAEAEVLHQRVLAIREKAFPQGHPYVALSLNNLASRYSDRGRYAEAEPLLKRALEIHEKLLPPEHPNICMNLNSLGLLYMHQGRYLEAEALFQRAREIREKQQPADTLDLAETFNNIAYLYALQGRDAEAEPLGRRAVAMYEQLLPPGSPTIGPTLDTLALISYNQKNYAEAEALWKRAIELSDGVIWLTNLARLYIEQERYAEAEPLAERAVVGGDRSQEAAKFRFDAYSVRAAISWHLGRRGEALEDLELAMDLAEQARGQSAGAEQERAGHFAQFAGAFERMVAWQVELGDAGKALGAIERGRARSLLDEMNLGGAELQVGRPVAERESLKRREGELKSRIAQIEARRDARNRQAPAGAGGTEDDQLEAELEQARQALYDHYRDERSTSPVYHNLLSVGAAPPRLSQLQRKLVGEGGLLLTYLLGDEGGYVVAVGAKAARVTPLEVDAAAAKTLGVEPGPLTAARLRAICANDRHTGVVERLARPETASAVTAQLAALWTVLVPQDQRQALTNGKIKKLIIVPDGPLALLAFETLVVEPGESPKFLLDVGPPILYAPSATVLFNLTEARAGNRAGEPAAQPVLTVANPVYGGAKRSPAAQASALDSLAARSRYGSSGGSLAALPYSGEESSWVADAYKKHGIASGGLVAGMATEANVRFNVQGRRVLHFACHGLTDQAHGNFFGALALTPGKQAATNPADDGFLMLSEIYELNLKSCELAILSACETNYGPQQRGEGVWALSRGFLVAGARRVVASNWLVDDEAGASLVGTFCDSLAEAEGAKQSPDYAAALHRAKRWVRKQEKWQSPYYWGTFVLVGPN